MKRAWIIDPAEDLPLAIIEDTEDGQGICEISGNGRTPAMLKTARLVSAAPGLLEALEGLFYARVFRNDLDETHIAALNKARAEIAKAKGQGGGEA